MNTDCVNCKHARLWTDKEQKSEDAVSRNLIIQTLNKMDRYVAEELTLCDTDKKFPKNEVFIVDDVYEQIVEQLPSVNPQPKTGHWIDITVGDMPAQACNQCKTFYPLAYTGGGHNYCPQCGAKMVEPQESEVKE